MTQEQLHQRQDMLTAAYREHKLALLKYSMSKLQSKTVAEDAVQDTFIRAWGFIVRGGEVDNMKSFLYRILCNLIIDEYRRRRTTSLDDLVEEELLEVVIGPTDVARLNAILGDKLLDATDRHAGDLVEKL